MISENPFSRVHFSLSLAQDAQTDTGLRHSVVRTPSFREEERREDTRPGDTLPKSLATVLEKRLLLNFTGNKVHKDKSDTGSHV